MRIVCCLPFAKQLERRFTHYRSIPPSPDHSVILDLPSSSFQIAVYHLYDDSLKLITERLPNLKHFVLRCIHANNRAIHKWFNGQFLVSLYSFSSLHSSLVFFSWISRKSSSYTQNLRNESILSSSFLHCERCKSTQGEHPTIRRL